MADTGHYARSSQPIQHMIYLYNYAGEPWKAQFHSREVIRELCDSIDNEYPGDEEICAERIGINSVCP